MNWFTRLFRPEPPPALDAVPVMTGGQFAFDNIVAFSTGWNRVSPKVDDVIIILESCSMGMRVRSDRRVRATSEAFSQRVLYGPKSDDLFIVRTDDGKHVPLSELRPCGLAARTWVYVT